MAADHEVLRGGGLTKRFGPRCVFEALDLNLRAGERLALVGPSGCGKTTLLYVLAGLDLPDAGRVEVRIGDEVVALDQLGEHGRTALRRRAFGFVFQFYNLVPSLGVADNVTLPRRLNRQPVTGDAAALARLTRLGLDGRHDALPGELSGGEQQRVAIARALAHGPRVVFADEPTGNLDVRQADAVFDLLLEHCAETGAALVFATHSARLAARADRIVDLAALDVVSA